MIGFILQLLGFDVCPEAIWHDWVYLEYSSEDDQRYKVDCEQAGRHLPHGCQGWNRQLHHRVCLNCEREESTIERFRQDYMAELSRRKMRHRAAEAIVRAPAQATGDER